MSDRDGAADGSTQPRAPAKSAATAGGGKGSAGSKARAGSKGGGKGLAAEDKAAAAAAAKEAAEFRRQLSALQSQVNTHMPPALLDYTGLFSCRRQPCRGMASVRSAHIDGPAT